MSKKDQPKYCYLDIDIGNYRKKLATAAAFVDATDTRYGFSSKDLRLLGGSELSRIEDLIQVDHEWSSKVSVGPNNSSSVEIRPPPSGQRIVIELFWDVAPLACENFSTLCSNANLSDTKKKVPIGESGKPLSYLNSIIHRVIPGFIMQGGDFVFGNGSGGESIFKKPFKDEKGGLALKHTHRGIVSMGNSGKNSNTSQFFITFGSTPQCDGKHVVFGRMLSGFEVLSAIETHGTKEGDPSTQIQLTSCGMYEPLVTEGAGYWFDQPSDSFLGYTPVFMCFPRILLIVPSIQVYKKFDKELRALFSPSGSGSLGICASLSYFVVCENIENPTSTNFVTTNVFYANEKESVKRNITNLLSRNIVDIVLFAPVCKSHAPNVPTIFTAKGIKKEELFIISKPVDAVQKIKDKSWITNGKTKWNIVGQS